MVQWQGEIDREQSGLKAAKLDSVNSLEVPNFFTITRGEIENFIGRNKDPNQILNSKIPASLMQKIKDAQDEIGMSSEVRNASGRAKNLVGGQRDSQRVSIRVSDKEKGLYEYQLNVGSSNLEKALKNVIASYYEAGKQDYPAIIIQKMVEPGETGSVVVNFTKNNSLLESTQGLGNSLEEGITTPDLYLVNDEGVKTKKIPEKQVKMSRNPMNGQKRKRKVSRNSSAFNEREIKNFVQKVRREGLSVKFVHKRGTFYIVDAFESEPVSGQEGIESLRVSKGEIRGQAGNDITLSDQTVSPEKYENSLISRKGAYTSNDAQRARAEEKPAIFSYSGELEEDQKVYIPEKSVEIQQPSRKSADQSSNQQIHGAVTATEVLLLEGEDVDLDSPFTGYQIKGSEISNKEVLQSYREIMEFSGQKYVLDTRKIKGEGQLNALEYLVAEQKFLLAGNAERELLRKAVKQEVDAVIAPQDVVSEVKKVLAEEEKKLILDYVRHSD